MIPRMAATIDKASDQLFKDSIFMVIKFCSVKSPGEYAPGHNHYLLTLAIYVWLTFMWIGGDSNPDAPVCAGSLSTYPCLPTLSSQTK